MAQVVTVNEVLDGHVVLDIECLDRVYLNAYVPILQSSGQVVAFMTQHLGMPIPSPTLMEKISTKFRRAVESFAASNGIPWVKFGKDDRKIAVMRRTSQPRRQPGGPGWRRSASRRSSSGSGLRPGATPRPPPRSTPS